MTVFNHTMTAEDHLASSEELLKQYALRPDANEPTFHNLRANELADGLRIGLARVRILNEFFPETLAAARQRWYRPSTVS